MSKVEANSDVDTSRGPVSGKPVESLSHGLHRSDNGLKKRYANQLANAAGMHIVLPLSGKPLVRTVFPYLLRWKPTLESLVDRIDATVEAFVDTGSDLWTAGLSRVPVLNYTPWSAAGDNRNTLIPSPAELRAALASKWGASSAWIDERFDVHLALLEDLTDKWLPSAPTPSAQDNRIVKTRAQRLFAVPYRVKAELMTYAVMATDRLQSATQQMIISLKNFAFAILVAPKLENPQAMPPAGRFVHLAYVFLHSKVEHLAQRMAIVLGAFNSEAFRKSAALTMRKTVSSVSTACRQYYNSWPIPSSEELQKKMTLFDGKVKEMYECLSEDKKKWIRRQYNRILRITRAMVGGRVSDAVAHFLAKSVIVQAIQDLSQSEAVSYEASDASANVLKDVKQE